VVTKIILEMGCNHNGDLNIAKRMIDDAKKLNVYGVKFQKRNLEVLPDRIKNLPRKDEKNSFGKTYYEHRKVLEFNLEQIKILKRYAESLGLIFSVSVFDEESMKEMIYQAEIKWIKLPSQFYLNEKMNHDLINYNNNHNGLIISKSTGMHTFNEIIDDFHMQQFDIIYYCRSIYPIIDYRDLDYGSMFCLYNVLFDLNIKKGYSSHDKDGKFIASSICLGTEYLERHYTLDKTMKGTDQSTVSSDFDEMVNIIRLIKETEEIISIKNGCAINHEQEISNRKFYIDNLQKGIF
jgi:sialic acid synthase